MQDFIMQHPQAISAGIAVMNNSQPTSRGKGKYSL
jgi:hypothetical protein